MGTRRWLHTRRLQVRCSDKKARELLLTSPTLGPISINGIGLKFNDGTISVLVDASFFLGPIGFTFVDAAINLELGDSILSYKRCWFSLAGLVVAFDREPLRLGGSFKFVDTAEMKLFAGGIVISLDPYQFTAAGMYGEVKKPSAFKTAFVMARLEGPLITLSFAEISGITGGFGYNSEVKLPAVENVAQFPFLGGTSVDDDLLVTLGNLVDVSGNGSFTIRDGSMWLAAGLKLTAFKMLDLDAVVVLSWNPSVTIGIVAVAILELPKGASTTFAHVELGILAVIDFEAGVFKVEAQLAPSSYVFDPSCQLTGGFAFYYWFNDRVPEREGDWVLSIGGFHRAFKRPEYYPNPPRLGISWQVGNNISIVGEAYFAITPKCCMAGGRLRATLSAGPLEAWYTTWADFLIKYDPFYFRAEGGIRIGVKCRVDLLITSFTVSVEVGANLLLEGPPLHGRVEVQLWVVSFNVNFGPDGKESQPLNLDEFYELVRQLDDQSPYSRRLAAPSKYHAPKANSERCHIFTCRGGLIEGKGNETITEEHSSWDVKADSFVFAINVRFALSVAIVEPPEWADPNLQPVKVSSSSEVYAKPMQSKTAISSEMNVKIVRLEPTYYDATEDEKPSEENWQVTGIFKAVPKALWGQCE